MRSRGAAPPEPPGNLVELGLEDEWLEAVTYVEIGPEGERIDKAQYVNEWQEAVRSRAAEDPLLRKVRDGERLSPGEEDTLARRLNRPEHYFNEENLRRAYREPGGTLIDFIRVALSEANFLVPASSSQLPRPSFLVPASSSQLPRHCVRERPIMDAGTRPSSGPDTP